MRPISILVSLQLALTVAAGAQNVKTEHDRNAKFAGYTGFAWAPHSEKDAERAARDEVYARRLIAGVESELAARGLSKKPAGEGVLDLTWTLETRQRTQVGNIPAGRSAVQTARPTTFTEVTYRLEMLDPASGKAVWQGKVSVEIDKEDSPEERLSSAAKKLLKKFPPKSG